MGQKNLKLFQDFRNFVKLSLLVKIVDSTVFVKLLNYQVMAIYTLTLACQTKIYERSAKDFFKWLVRNMFFAIYNSIFDSSHSWLSIPN